MTYLLLINALFLSGIAAFYAVSGLIAIFATAVIPIAIMGTALETAKLVVASWLYRRWNDITRIMRWYFSASLIVLMLLTSMGIFGYLSKAHLDQAVPSGEISSKVYLLDDKIKYQKGIVDRNNKTIKQLDDLVEQSIGRTTDEKGINSATELRRKQEQQRNKLVSEIDRAQAELNKLNNERAPIASQLRKVEAEVGPIKYIAALIYGDRIDENLLEKAVRFVIIVIVFVFDPLAVMMLIAWNREMILQGKTPNNSPIIPSNIPEAKPIKIIEKVVEKVMNNVVDPATQKLRKKLQVMGTLYTEKKRKLRESLKPKATDEEIRPTAFYELDKTDIYDKVSRPTDARPEKFNRE
ncbi:hypothetical protein EBU71_00090 [bacterium]|nr:hypothetical protein [Candidatus Elulimicrobium humile]